MYSTTTFRLFPTIVLILFCYGRQHNGVVEGSNILFFHLAATASHRTSIWPLAEKLADNGHNVTYIYPLEKKVFTHPAIEEITPSKMVPILHKNVGDYDINFRLNNSNHVILQESFSWCFDLCGAFYDSPEIQEWMHRPGLNYDLVMIDSSLGECIYGIVHKFKAKTIIFVPAIIPYHWDGFGIVPESSSIPSTLMFYGRTPKPSQMDIFGRIWSTLEPLIWRLGYLDYVTRVEHLIREKMNLTNLPHLGEFERNTSLVLVNNHYVEDYPLSLPPLFQSYSGLWCSKDKLKQRKPLPDNIAKFVEGNDSDGFIYISFGSAVNAANMPLEIRKNFFDTFNKLPKLRFLWRWIGTIPEDKPDNLLLQKWFPQHDILAHPKIKAFVTQCGRPSTQEALCNGTPLLTIPVFGDQDYNADRLEYIGAAINLEIASINSENFRDAINELAYNDKYSKKMAQMSAMFKDRPLDPLDNAFYWTQFILRHDDASLLKPLAIDQTWYQRRLLDVYLIILGALLSILALSVVLVFLALKYIMLIFGGKSEVKITKKNRKLD